HVLPAQRLPGVAAVGGAVVAVVARCGADPRAHHGCARLGHALARALLRRDGAGRAHPDDPTAAGALPGLTRTATPEHDLEFAECLAIPPTWCLGSWQSEHITAGGPMSRRSS